MSEQQTNVYKFPQEVDERELEGSVVIVIDVLRATSTICQALAAGAREVVPFVEVEEALVAANQVGRTSVVLGGERKGLRINGFDLGNSPAEYTADAIQGRPVWITTTNGTRALQHARLAKRVIVASFLNLSAVVESIKDVVRLDILCAGTDGSETSEDILLAGAIAHKRFNYPVKRVILNRGAEVAMLEWVKLIVGVEQARQPLHQLLADRLKGSLGGRNLIDVELESDLANCAQIDRLHMVPELDVGAWRITAPHR